MTDNQSPLAQIKNLRKYFPDRKPMFDKGRRAKAIDDISFDIFAGETVGLVGESGCGKSTLGRAVVGLIKPTAGTIFIKGQDISTLKGREKKKLSEKAQLVFQDPSASLNPRRTIAEILSAPYVIHGQHARRRRRQIIKDLIRVVGLDVYHLSRYPHELSGGQKQRVGIARALALNPELVVCDEPVSALDVSIQAQVINLLEDLQQEFHLTYLFISHDLSVVYHISDRVLVMYLGKIVEMADYRELYTNPLHPYTRALLSANPALDPDSKKDRIVLEGDVPSNANPPPGCRFHMRCPSVFERCRLEEPILELTRDAHVVACHLYTGIIAVKT